MFYDSPKTDWYQGDIVSAFPFVVSDLTDTNKGKSLKLFDVPAIVISQTCDLQPDRRPFAQVCPIFDFEYLKAHLLSEGKTEQGANDAIESVRRSKTEYRYYIPADITLGIKEGYVDLNFICTVTNKQLRQLQRVATLKDHPRQVFAYFVSNLFLKPHIS